MGRVLQGEAPGVVGKPLRAKVHFSTVRLIGAYKPSFLIFCNSLILALLLLLALPSSKSCNLRGSQLLGYHCNGSTGQLCSRNGSCSQAGHPTYATVCTPALCSRTGRPSVCQNPELYLSSPFPNKQTRYAFLIFP